MPPRPEANRSGDESESLKHSEQQCARFVSFLIKVLLWETFDGDDRGEQIRHKKQKNQNRTVQVGGGAG